MQVIQGKLRVSCPMDKSTSREQRNQIDEQIARYIFATNAPFRSVEHPEFKRLIIGLLRSGYAPPSRFDVSNALLDTVYEKECEKRKGILEGITVSLSLDGWSNIQMSQLFVLLFTQRMGMHFLYILLIHLEIHIQQNILLLLPGMQSKSVKIHLDVMSEV